MREQTFESINKEIEKTVKQITFLSEKPDLEETFSSLIQKTTLNCLEHMKNELLYKHSQK